MLQIVASDTRPFWDPILHETRFTPDFRGNH